MRHAFQTIREAEQNQTCQVCGASVPKPTGPVTIGGEYGGWSFFWDRGVLRLTAIRCAEHPLHVEETVAERAGEAEWYAAHRREVDEMDRAGF